MTEASTGEITCPDHDEPAGGLRFDDELPYGTKLVPPDGVTIKQVFSSRDPAGLGARIVYPCGCSVPFAP